MHAKRFTKRFCARNVPLPSAREIRLGSNIVVTSLFKSGVKSGKAAGCIVVAVPDPRFSLEERAEFVSTADVVLKDLTEFDGSTFGLGIL